MSEYTYDLPSERIAEYPLPKRDQSKLLVYRSGEILHARFGQVVEFLPGNSTLFFNDTKVISARLIFQKDTGAEIETFLLNPLSPSPLVQVSMQATGSVQWHCVIGNLKRWTAGTTLEKKDGDMSLKARLVDRASGAVEFTWSPVQRSFAEVILQFGQTPLPPYIHRKAEPEDRERYQTVYAQSSGAVAAPTAGLHFTPEVISLATNHGILTDFLTLHVGAGTFKPVKVVNAMDHDMHSEQIILTKKNIDNLLLPDKKVIAVGTTSLRTLESVYWYGVRLLSDPDAEFTVRKFDPYTEASQLPSRESSLYAVASMMKRKNLSSIAGETSIYIVPGYIFRVCDGLITNFHQPGSTLLLLVAALVGNDWKKVYAEAADNDYRFLSYGDSSLLMP